MSVPLRKVEQRRCHEDPPSLAFQENLKNWLAGPPASEQLTVVGSYNLF